MDYLLGIRVDYENEGVLINIQNSFFCEAMKIF